MTLRAALSAGGSLSALAGYRRFILYRLDWDATKNKFDKVPCSPEGRASNAHDETIQLPASAAIDLAERMGPSYGVGFVFNASDGFWFLDIDDCLMSNNWSELATSLLAALPGAAVEVSVSGKGLHVFGRGTIPEHSSKNTALGLEFYHDGRFVALTGANAIGSAATDCSAGVAWLVANYFPAKAAGDADIDWSNTPDPDMSDDQLIDLMLRTKSASTQFGGKASIAALWAADVKVLAKAFPDSGNRAYDASGADQALANHLAWWCRKNAAWMWALMWKSGLRRDKWNPETGHKDYLARTIANAINFVKLVRDKKADSLATSNAGGSAPPPATAAPAQGGGRTQATDYVFYLPSNSYILLKTGAEIKKEALQREFDQVTIAGIDLDRRVHCQAWDPLEPQFIFNRVMAVGTAGWQDLPGSTTMNTYQPPNATYGDAAQAAPWLHQIQRNYPDHWKHFVDYAAHLVQHPGVKPNHAIVLGGPPGIGKDSILEGVIYAIGMHNLGNISPHELFGDFTPWTKCLLLRINEIHDMGETGHITRTTIYERLKIITAAPPDQLTYNNKNVKSYPVRNCCGVVITTNHLAGAMYMPPDDRRYFIMWSEQNKDSFSPDQWQAYWDWFNATGPNAGQMPGKCHVAALLKTWDLSAFNPKAPPERTPAWHMMVSSSISEGDMELADCLDALNRPDAITLEIMTQHLEHAAKQSGMLEDLKDRKQYRRWPGRMAAAGYTPVRNPQAKADGLYRIAGKRMTVYAKRDLSEGDRVNAAEALARFRQIPQAR
jgi:hypothetical protein